jgi:membrane protein implicated in regulation of membrane protease activity
MELDKGIYNLRRKWGMSMWEWLASPIFWLVLGIILIVLEIFTLSFYLLWFGIGAIAAGIVAYLIPSLSVVMLIFTLVSLLLLIFTRPLTKKWFRQENLQSGVYALVGREGIVVEAIGKDGEVGRVKIGGEVWTAKSVDRSIPEGSAVRVVQVEGVTLLVENREGGRSE